MLVPICSEYTKDLFNCTGIRHMEKFLAFEIKDESVLSDAKKFIALRME